MLSLYAFVGSPMPNAAVTGIELFYDGACPFCRREVAYLRKKDHVGLLCFTDIAVPGFTLSGISNEALMARIHARLPDGTFVEGVEVFRLVYTVLGFRRSVAVSRWPVVRHVLAGMYRVFARYRPRQSGRCNSGSCSH